MLRQRVIPVLLYHNQGLYKTVKFEKPKYVGDPINAIRIFNEKEVDELIFLDIDASKKNRKPDFNLIKRISSECFMPLAYGGGIKTLQDMEKIFSIGVEKVVLNTIVLDNFQILKEASKEFGKQSIVVAIDIKRDWLGRYKVYDHRIRKIVKNLDLPEYIQRIQEYAGELFINSVDKDGTMEGYDINLISKLKKFFKIPVIVCGGAKDLDDIVNLIKKFNVSAAAGSLFVFKGKYRAVLINYPSYKVLETLIGSKEEVKCNEERVSYV